MKILLSILFLSVFCSSFHSVFSQNNAAKKLGTDNEFAFSSYIDPIGGYTQIQVTGIKEKNKFIPNVLGLKQNYPNPFNPTTVIEYSLPEKSYVELNIYNLLGVKVATLDKSIREAGIYKVEFDGSDLSSGLFIYELKTDKVTISRKMLLLK
jgi:hypothetical protein